MGNVAYQSASLEDLVEEVVETPVTEEDTVEVEPTEETPAE